MSVIVLESIPEAAPAVTAPARPDRPVGRDVPGEAIESATVHALLWLVVSSAAGVVLAMLLVAPSLGTVLGPLGFGRWAPLHLDLALYGWLALPLVAVLFRAYGLGGAQGRPGTVAVHAWSACLFAGAISWLAGDAGGKVFLDWRGPVRAYFLAAMVVLAGTLRVGLRRLQRPKLGRSVLWVVLCAVPVAMFAATDPAVYPPVNPASGGPTGADLLGSTLVLVAIFIATPALLGLHRESDRRATMLVAGLIAAHAAFTLVVSRGDATHRDPIQVAAVVSVLPWMWLTPTYLRRLAWPASSRLWRIAALGWGAALVASGVVAFLPGVLERVKFTNALVGHAHVAMAGMATCFAAIVLVTLNAGGRLQHVLSGRLPFALWNAGCAAQVVALTAVGALEAQDPGVLFRPGAVVAALYAVRAAAGVAMVVAAGMWLRAAMREVAR